MLSFSVLDSAVKFTDQIRPIRLPSISTENPDVYAGSSVSIMGWGNGTKKTLEMADIQVYERRFLFFRSIYSNIN
jgi:hypothetical protein